MRYIFSVYEGKVDKAIEIFLRSLSKYDYHLLFNVVGLTDVEKQEIEGIYSGKITIFDIPKEEWDGKRMACKILRLKSMPFQKGDEVFVLDTDLVLQDDIFQAFHQEFDVGVTGRHYPYWYKINGGVWCFRYTDRGKAFIDFFAEQVLQPSWPPFVAFQLMFGHKGNLDWWCDQDFLCVAHEKGVPFDCQIVDISCKYNYCPSVEENIPGTYEKAKSEILAAIGNKDIKVLHFKGRLKELLQNYEEYFE